MLKPISHTLNFRSSVRLRWLVQVTSPYRVWLPTWNLTSTAPRSEILQEWYEKHWNNAEDISAELLKVIERQIHEYSPFEVYTKSCRNFSAATKWLPANGKNQHPKFTQCWTNTRKKVIRRFWKSPPVGGAFLCDGVGLGKTLIGLMVIERLIYDRKRVIAALSPKPPVNLFGKNICKNIYPAWRRLF